MSQNSTILILDSKKAYVNGVETTISGAPKMFDNTVYVPVRAFGESIGAVVNYVSEQNATYIYVE